MEKRSCYSFHTEMCLVHVIMLTYFFSLSVLCRCKFFSLTETPEDYTIIVDEDGFKGRFTSCL